MTFREFVLTNGHRPCWWQVQFIKAIDESKVIEVIPVTHSSGRTWMLDLLEQYAKDLHDDRIQFENKVLGRWPSETN